MTASDEFRSITERTAEGLTVRWFGECDVAARDVIDNDRLLTDSEGQLIEIDLGEVTFMDSAGIHCLLEIRRRAEGSGAQLVVTNPSPPVRRVLEVTGLMTLLEPDSAPGRP